MRDIKSSTEKNLFLMHMDTEHMCFWKDDINFHMAQQYSCSFKEVTWEQTFPVCHETAITKMFSSELQIINCPYAFSYDWT